MLYYEHMKNISGRRGFTLIEVLIVVAIVGLLASVVLVGLAPAQRRGRDARRLTDLKEMQTGLELYYNKCGYYPGTAQASNPCGAWSAVADWNGLVAALQGSSLGITQLPKDPSSNRSYDYATNNGGSSYILSAQLEDENNSVFNNYTAPSDTFGLTCTKPYYCLVF